MDLALLDTDMVSEVLKQKNPRVTASAVAYLQQHGEFGFSSITRFELLRGLKEKNATAQLVRFREFCLQSLILAVSDAVLDRAADLWVAVRRVGQPGNDADLIVAATALELQRVLVTGNRRHFAWIPGLRLGRLALPLKASFRPLLDAGDQRQDASIWPIFPQP